MGQNKKIKEETSRQSIWQSNDFLADMFNSIQDGISVLDRDYNVVRVNKWIEKTYATQMPIVGKKCYRVYQLRKSICPWCPTKLSFKDGKAHSATVPIMTDKDYQGWIQLSTYPIKDKGKQVVGVIEYVKDITELKKSEEQLRESEQKYRDIFELAQDIICVVDRRGVVRFINTTAEKMTGYSSNELTGKHFSKLKALRAKDIPHYVKLFAQIIKGEKIAPLELEIRRKDGSRATVEARVSVLKDGRVLTVASDITEQKILQNKLKIYFSAIENALDGIVLTDMRGKVLYFNNAACEIFGYTADEMKDLEVKDFSATAKAANWLENELSKKGEFCNEIQGKRKNGETFDAILTVSIVKDDKGKPNARMGMFRDVSNIKKAEQRWNSLVENVPAMLVISDSRGTIQYINRVLSGFDKKEVIGSKVYDYVVPQSQPKLKESIAKVIKTGEPTNIEVEGYGAHKSLSWYDASLGAIKEEGKVVAVANFFTDITEHKKAMQELYNAIKQKEIILNTLSELLIFQDLDHRITWANQMAASSVNMTLRQMEGKLCYQLWHNRKEPHPDCPLERIKQTKKPEEGEITTPDGRIWLVRGFPIKDEQGTLVGLLEAVENITEKKEAEEKLKTATRAHKDILENSPFGIYIVNKQGCIDYVNKSMLEISGDSEEQFMSLNVFELPTYVEKDISAKIKEGLKGKHFKVENITYTSSFSGKTTIRNFVGIPLNIEEENKLLMFVEDITERRHGEIEILKQKQLLSNIISAVPEFIFWKNTDLVYAGCNDNFAKAAGVNTPEHIIGKTDYDLAWSREETEFFRKCDREVIDKNEPILNTEESRTQADGKVAILLNQRVPLRDQEGKVIGVLGIYTDVSKYKKIEKELSAKLRDLQRFHKVAVGRELKMIELKKKLKELQRALAENKQ
ncbi:MAG: PAS domain-containing protein [Candidatus Omnitrophica bacterium]|nr:PAS domain-containing protein [Candidatus Omnitrophota bacterium]